MKIADVMRLIAGIRCENNTVLLPILGKGEPSQVFDIDECCRTGLTIEYDSHLEVVRIT